MISRFKAFMAFSSRRSFLANSFGNETLIRALLTCEAVFGAWWRSPVEIITFCTLLLYCFTVKHRKLPFKTSSWANRACKVVHSSKTPKSTRHTKHRLAISKLIFAESLFCFFTGHSVNSQRPLLKRRLLMVISRRRWLMSVESRLN